MGDSYVYADSPLPEWALLGQYGNGAAKSAGRLEYIWLPTEDGNAIPVGLYRNGKLYAVHSDHLGTPRLITNEDKRPVWQWPYSAFGANAPTGILKATKNAKQAYTTQPVLLKATQAPLEYNLRYPGQYYDEESQLSYNYQRSYQAGQGRYTQADPIGLNGGMNRFGYVGRDTLGAIDPLGLLEQFTMELNSQPISSLKCACGESYPAFSGNPPYRNDPTSTVRSNIGAAPEGLILYH